MGVYSPSPVIASQVATVATSESTASTSFTDLTTTTDTVTVTVNTMVLIVLSSRMLAAAVDAFAAVSFLATGANSIAAADSQAIMNVSSTVNAFHSGSWSKVLTGLTPGSTTFKMKYRVGSSTGTFQDRSISVVPLN